MTREQVKEILETIPTIGEQVDAIEIAIRSLEAWDEVVKEIKGAGRIGKLTCVDIIKKHLKEVEDDKG